MYAQDVMAPLSCFKLETPISNSLSPISAQKRNTATNNPVITGQN